MDDWQTLIRGGDEQDIEQYANQTNGHNFTEDDWVFDRDRDERTIDEFLTEENKNLPADESNVY